MESALLVYTVAAFAVVVTGAPTYTESEEAQIPKQYFEDYQYLRMPRSKFGLQYVTPCAAASAAAASINSLYRPQYQAPYNYNVNRYPGSNYGYGQPHLRSVEEQMPEPEMLAFSDTDQLAQNQDMMMDHNSMARFHAALAPVSTAGQGLTINGPALTPSYSGTAYGVFPNAHVGGCDIPLLFSCSPSISSGHMATSHGHSSAAIANTYRLAEEQRHSEQGVHAHHDVHEHSESQEMSDQSAYAVPKAGHLQHTHP